jgi:hypothetical protein
MPTCPRALVRTWPQAAVARHPDHRLASSAASNRQAGLVTAARPCLDKLPPLSVGLTAPHGMEKPRQLSRTLAPTRAPKETNVHPGLHRASPATVGALERSGAVKDKAIVRPGAVSALADLTDAHASEAAGLRCRCASAMSRPEPETAR